MRTRIIGVIQRDVDSDLLQILQSSDVTLQCFKPGYIEKGALDHCHALAILGGTQEKPLLFHPSERIEVEKQIKLGKKVLAEYCESIGDVYCAPPASTRFEQIMFVGGETQIDGLEAGDLLDDQCNMRISPHTFGLTNKRPLLQYTTVAAHRHAEVTGDILENTIKRAIWFEEQDNILRCAFRISNFSRARFAPLNKWQSLVKYMLEWLCECEVNMAAIKESYYTLAGRGQEASPEDFPAAVDKAMVWYEQSGTLLENGKKGVLEGLGTEIYPDGSQRIAANLRNDCVGESALAYVMHYLLTEDKKQLHIAEQLFSGRAEWFHTFEEGIFKGMERWSDTGWGVAYQDDIARAIISQMLANLYLGKSDRMDICSSALDFLLRTTGTDGMRKSRTDNGELSQEKMETLSSKTTEFPSAHYNGYYMAALLLAYKLTGNETYREAGIKGLETIMAAYPSTKREQSETQELCRLILPLSWLYWVTGEPKHKEWLYQVTEDLQRFSHASGGYLEWDEGYTATMHGTTPGEESSMLTQNGDPVVDLLYSVNWLPAGYMQAYFVTKDPYFQQLWEKVSKFLVSVQIHSDNKQIDGAWARAFDVEINEVFGYPGDGGWGPWAIESGWTMSVITTGLCMGLLEEQLKECYK